MIYRMRSAERLFAWRRCPYRETTYGGYGPTPPNWFGAVHQATMLREVDKWGGRKATLHYGDGIGGKGEACRPDLRMRLAKDILGRLRHYGSEYWSDDIGSDAFRGVVAALPHGRGFLAGVEWGEAQNRRGGFAMGGGSLDCRWIHGSAEDAAKSASDAAELAADECREDRERERAEEEEAERLAELAESGASGND